MATYNIAINVPEAKDEKLQRIFTLLNEKLVEAGKQPWSSIENWFENHLINWATGLWDTVVSHEADEVQTGYRTLNKDNQNQIRSLLQSLGVDIDQIP